MKDVAKKSRVMTEKGFVFKCGTKAANSAAAFISAHREFLMSGTLKNVSEPILSKMDAGDILPKLALEELRKAVFSHMLAQQAAEIKNSIGKTREYTSTKKHTATIYDKNNNVLTFIDSKGQTQDLTKSFNLPQEAERWVDLRLVEQSAGAFAVIKHSNTNQETVVNRESSYMSRGALSRVFKPQKVALHKNTSKRSASLRSHMQVKQDYASFSRG